MSARVKSVQQAQKAQGKCTGPNCEVEIRPGDPYRYFRPGFRSKAKVVRCMKAECTPRQSELESSKLADVYAAQETAQDAISSAETVSDLVDAVSDCASSIREVIDEYEQAIEAMPALEDSTRDRISSLEEYADGLESFSPDEPEEDADNESTAEALDIVKEEANGLVSGLEL